MTDVLDHGYVRLVESWGSDEGIIDAARMSTQGGFRGWGPMHAPDCDRPSIDSDCGCPAGDEKLLRYLWEHKHSTPFEMAGAMFEIQAPLFVFREWHRHRTQSYSEASARYAPLPDVNYVPGAVRLLGVPKTGNKQAGAAKGAPELEDDDASEFRRRLAEHYSGSQKLYEWALARGVPKELARLCLPVGRYSRMRASANLRNWLGFLTLRLAPDAQWEIRKYAEAVRAALAEQFPRTMALHAEGL